LSIGFDWFPNVAFGKGFQKGRFSWDLEGAEAIKGIRLHQPVSGLVTTKYKLVIRRETRILKKGSNYFPIQNLVKMLPRTSSTVISPVMLPR
jgi:hypothetical protein